MKSSTALAEQKVDVSNSDEHVTATIRQIFRALDIDGSGTVSSQFFLAFLERSGIMPDDPRIEYFMEYLESIDAIKNDVALSLTQFHDAIDSCGVLIHKAISGNLRVPDF